MLDRRLFFIFFTITLFVSVINAERARNDNLQDDFIDDNSDDNEYVIDAIKRFLGKKKTTTTTGAPNTGAISALITATPKGRVKGETTRSSILDPFGKDRKTLSTTTSRYSRTRATSGPVKEACGVISPCKNGGTCKTLSSGKYYCFCAQDYYGKTCENKFITSGSANLDRTRKDHCASNPCRNKGECVGLRTTYYCRCKSPFYGTNCDKSIMSKREEIMDESSESDEQDLYAYERDLEEDREDLRRAMNNENY